MLPHTGACKMASNGYPHSADVSCRTKALAKILRATFRHALKKTELFTQVPRRFWRINWVIDIRGVGKGKTALKYLAPYNLSRDLGVFQPLSS